MAARDLAAEAEAARTAADVLAVVARATWATAHDGAECPAECIPSPADLAAIEVPEAVGLEVVARHAASAAAVAGDAPAPAAAGPAPQRMIAGALALDLAWIAVRVDWTEREPKPSPGGGADVQWCLHLVWRDGRQHDATLRHPLAPIVAAWQAQPPTVEPDTRADRRIMPALRVTGPAPERDRGRLFGGLHDGRRPDPDATLPLFPELEPERHRVPLLEVCDVAGVPLRSRGRGAPIEARLIVRGGLLMIRPEHRGMETVRLAVTVGELLDGLYPTGPRRLSQHWPTIEDALLRARNFTVTDAAGGRWFPMALRRLPAPGPDGKPSPDDVVVVDLAPPPGITSGGTLDLPALDVMGVKSGPAWRAYIAARTLVWLPGKTRRPAPRRGRGAYGWSADPADYPVLTLADLRRLAFGDGDKGDRARAAIIKPWADLPDVVMLPAIDARTGARGYRLLPAEAAEAIRRAGAQPGTLDAP